MKTDRELLEVAAKAAGIKARWFKVNKWRQVGDIKMRTGQEDVFGTHHRKPWNPLTDDGDALRLARALKLCIDFATGHVVFQIDEHELMIAFDKGDPVDEAKAIVRAAASIGESMQ